MATKAVRNSLKRLTGSHKAKEDFSNDVVRYQSVSVASVQEIQRGVLSGEEASGVELFVLTGDVGAVQEGTTVKLTKKLKDCKTAKCRVPYTGLVDIPLKNLEAKGRKDWTIEDVCEHVILPPCREETCFYLDLMDPDSVGKTYQGAFVSQARKSKFADLVDALVYHYQGKDLSRQYVWLDIFCANQPKLTSKDDGLPDELKHKRWDQLTFGLHDAIQHFDDRLIFFNSWLNPYPLSRAWCVWEIYGTVQCDKSIDLIFAPGAVDHFVDTVKTDFDSIMQNLADLNLEKAECHKQEDLEMIHKAVEKKVGFHQLNSTITALLREWLVKTARQAVQKQQRGARQSGWWKRQSGIERNTDLAKVLNQIGRFFRQQGSYGEAEPLLREALAIRKTALGNQHHDVATSLNNLALLLNNQVSEKIVQILAQQPNAVFENADHFYLSQGKYDEAEPLYRESLDIRRKVYGNDHPSVATGLNNLALLLQKQVSRKIVQILAQQPNAVFENADHFYLLQGKYDEAEPLYCEALAIDRKVSGDEHPNVATSLNNLASLLESQVSSFGANVLCSFLHYRTRYLRMLTIFICHRANTTRLSPSTASLWI